MTSGQSKKQAALALAAVFVAGAAMGFAGSRFLANDRVRAWDMTPRQYRGHLLNTLTKQLELTGPQQAEVEEILDEVGDRFQAVGEAIEPEMEALRTERAERIMLVLMPPQRTKYEEILEERSRRREAHRNRVFRDRRGR